MTNHCVDRRQGDRRPDCGDFWTPRDQPGDRQPYTNSDPGSRTAWGVDNNRNNTVGTLFDGYIGASNSCTGETYTGPRRRPSRRSRTSSGSRTRSRTSSSRTTSTASAATSCGRRARTCRTGRGRRRPREHRRREVLLQGRRPDPQPDQGGPGHGHPTGAHRSDRGRPLLGGGKQRRRALVQPRRDRVQLRDGCRPVRDDAVGRVAWQETPASGSATGTGSTPATSSRSTPARRTRRPGRSW